MSRLPQEFDYKNKTWDVLDSHFLPDPDVLYKHQLDSFNNFVDVLIPSMMQHGMPIEAHSISVGSKESSRHHIELYIRKVSMSKPITYDRQYQPLLPHVAREKNLTYGAPLFIDFEIRHTDGATTVSQIEEKVFVAKIPVMIGSKYCHLYGRSDAERAAMGECPMDRGGYFIVGGGEKIIISQERPIENNISVFEESDTGKPYVARAEVKSTIDQRFFPIKITVIKLTKVPDIKKVDVAGQKIVVFLPYGEKPIPLFVVFKALGIIDDKEIFSYLTDGTDDEINTLLLPSAIEGHIIKTQGDAIAYIANSTRITLLPDAEKPDINFRLKYVQDLLQREFLPHVGNNVTKKLRFLSLMVQKLLQAYINPNLYTDRDKLTNKRLDLPGTLFSQIFRFWFQKLLSDIKGHFVKELKRLTTAESENFGITLSQAVRRIIQKSNIEAKMKYALSTGNWFTNRKQANSAAKKGISQVLQRLSRMGTVSHNRRIMSPLERAGSKHEPPRRLHGTQIPKICPNETPEGAQVGTVKNLSMLTHVTIETSSKPVLYCLEKLGMIDVSIASSAQIHRHTKIMVNGDFVGVTPSDKYVDVHKMVNSIRHLKLIGRLSKFISISWHTDFNTIYVYTDGGRYSYPYYMIDENNRFEIDRVLKDLSKYNIYKLSSHLGLTEETTNTLSDPNRAVIEFMDTYEDETAMIAETANKLIDGQTLLTLDKTNYYGRLSNNIDLNDVDLLKAVRDRLAQNPNTPDINVRSVKVLRKSERYCQFELDGSDSMYLNRFLSGNYVIYTHCMIHPATIHGVLGANIPFPDHNQSPRNAYQCSMGKQAIGTYVTNPHMRLDTTASFMIYPHRPVVQPRMARYTGLDKMHHGRMSMHGIACLSGYNQEDSLISNIDSAKRGAFNICHYRTYSNKLQKLPNNDTDGEKFAIPPDRTLGRKVGTGGKDRYHAIVRHNNPKKPQLPALGSIVHGNDIIIPKFRIITNKKNKTSETFYTDVSTTVRATEEGMVDMVIPNEHITQCEDDEGYQICKVRLCEYRTEDIGDKYASRSAQKGTVGMQYNSADMIFNQDGSSPDKVMNAQAIPSRMTIGQLIEAIASKEGVLTGKFHDGTPFTEFDLSEIKTNLDKLGYNECGDEIMYNGQTGGMFDVPIFFNPTYYQRLKHMVADKMHARGLGPIQGLTRQPAEGRGRAGGLRTGEMERDCFIAHGAARYLKEKLLESSDIFEVFISKQRKTVIAANPSLGIYQYGTKDIYGTDTIKRLHIPFAMHLFRNEAWTSFVDMQLIVN